MQLQRIGRCKKCVWRVLKSICSVQIGHEPFGAYIISMTHLPSDVLAVHLLQKEMACQ
jgi:phosphoenolpyruvate carboxylase